MITDLAEIALSLNALSVRYGGVTAVDRVSLDVRRGRIVGLIGPNGAGKTTLIDAVSGFAPSAGGGSVTFGGHRLDGLKPHQRVRMGLGRTFQGLELWEDLSGRENIMVGLHAARGAHPDIGDLSALLSLDDVLDRPVRELSQGQRQLVSVARSLAGGPDVLLLDEPASGLDSTESLWLAERLRRVRDSGVTIVMVDHDMNLMLSVCDRIHVLDLGRLIASGTPDEIRQDPRVTEAYLGTAQVDQVGQVGEVDMVGRLDQVDQVDQVDHVDTEVTG